MSVFNCLSIIFDGNYNYSYNIYINIYTYTIYKIKNDKPDKWKICKYEKQ